jgi:two-component system, chemotaxis family, sensor histidine kinase and response regulator PixL
MTDDQDFQESLDRYFEIEAAELLQTIEETLITLVEEKTIERVHTLMRAAHTIKGSAANCGFKTIETIAHHLEDVFQALYPAELEIDPELGSLLMEGYDCLYDPLNALLAGIPYDEAATLERTATLFAKLQDHLGDFFGRETPLPTAAELGFDVIGSIFTDSIPQDLEDLATAIAGQNAGKVNESLRSLAEFLLELGGSYSLPGIAAIATTTLSALDRHPGRAMELAPIALANFQQAQIAIIGGDRSVGGEVSAALNAWNEGQVDSSSLSSINDDNSADWLSLTELTENSIAPDQEPLTTESASDDWLSLVDDAPAATTELASETATESASEDWLSLIDDAPVATTESTAEAESASEDWLSLVDDAPATTTESNSEVESASEDWLSLVDDAPATTTESITEAESASEDWLSLVDDAPTESTETASEAESTSEDWLSLVDNQDAAIDESVEIIDGDSDIIEVSSFVDAETVEQKIDPQARKADYLIEVIETSSNSALALSNISGIDRIFQSIWIEPPATEEIQPPPTAATGKTSADREEPLVSVRVATIQLERLSHTIGELLIDDNQQYLRSEKLQALAQSTVEQYRRCEQKLRLVSDWADKNTLMSERPKFTSSRSTKRKPKKGKKAANEIGSQFDSLELDVYSESSILIQNLTDEIAELGIKLSNLLEMTQKSRMTLGKRKLLLAEAQSELFEARMVEISTVLNRFPRLLQQMIASHRKPAQLQLIGSEVSIDKIIAEKLYDPLLHLIRNAYDHGVEAPEVRAAQGKSETGKLTIKAYHQGNRTRIEVSDDGQGLNWKRIRQRAIDTNLLDASYAATEAELAEIMFAPGFSTAEKVNDLSGRGIGLDVVRDRIGALNGTIDVRSVLGQGTTFVMQFPLNLTTTRLLICESAGLVYGLHSEAISQVLLPTPDRIQDKASFANRETSKFLRWGDGAAQKLIPIYPVHSLLDYQCSINDNGAATNLFPATAKNSTNALLLLEIDDQHICLEVNRILVEQELVVKTLGQTFGLSSYIQGYSVLGDGNLTLAIDPVELLARVRTNNTPTTQSNNFANFAAIAPSTTQPALPPAIDTEIPSEVSEQIEEIVSRTAGKQLQVLVVDDSLVQRQSLVRSLTKAGCQVIQASHGREGILRLQEHPRIRLVVCDIEMPQMNGFEFLSHCRQDPKLSQIPIVMLTTRGGQKHRQLAMTLGAKDYLTKPQSEKDLLDIVAKLDQPVGV